MLIPMPTSRQSIGKRPPTVFPIAVQLHKLLIFNEKWQNS